MNVMTSRKVQVVVVKGNPDENLARMSSLSSLHHPNAEEGRREGGGKASHSLDLRDIGRVTEVKIIKGKVYHTV